MHILGGIGADEAALARGNDGLVSSLLQLRELAIGIGGRRLGAGLSLQLDEGEVVAVGGPSGGGKTTLLRTVAGLIDPLEGALLLRGESPDAIGWPRYRRRVSYLSQRPTLLDISVRDNLARPFRYGCAGGAFDHRVASRLLTELQLDEKVLEQRARTLSEGQKQRVSLLRALLVEPEVLLLDEPTSALDPDNVAAVEQLLARFEGAILLVSHDPAQVERLASGSISIGEVPDG